MAGDLLDDLPPPQRLALGYAPASARPATLALLALDARLAAIVRRKREPVLAQMRLAWWRERLAEDPRAWPEGEAVLALLREWRDPAALAPLVDGWEALLGETLDAATIGEFAEGRSAAFAGLAVVLGVAPEPAAMGAKRWALGDLAAHLSDPAERKTAFELAAALPRCPRLPRALRPLRVLEGLAERSLKREGAPLLDGPGAMWLALRVGIGGG